MKKLILLISISLCACATDKQIIKNVAPIEIMESCKEYIKPIEGTPAELMKVILENKKVYVNCYNQNEAKKDYIKRQEIK